MKPTKLFAILLAVTLVSNSSADAVPITIDTVPVGNVNNANDPATGNLYGGVNNAYSIGKYEVTVDQYAAFLNAVAATDPNGLYDTNMAADAQVAGITRSGASGSFSYSVTGSLNHPIAYVGWSDAIRFVNWLHNGQPTGSQNAGTTEDGAYDLVGVPLSAVLRKANAQWFLPSENEWYKAAYHQPAAQSGDADDYWNYPMRTNSVPYSDQPPGGTPDNTRVGNFYSNDGSANGYDDGYAVTGSTSLSSQNYLTDVGAYSSSPSYYGTFDQGGGVMEWNEAIVGGGRGVRGGAWTNNGNASFLQASFRLLMGPPTGLHDVGFRVATITVPEPSTALLIAIVGFGLFLGRSSKTTLHP